jgi:hypothetical protein
MKMYQMDEKMLSGWKGINRDEFSNSAPTVFGVFSVANFILSFSMQFWQVVPSKGKGYVWSSPGGCKLDVWQIQQHWAQLSELCMGGFAKRMELLCQWLLYWSMPTRRMLFSAIFKQRWALSNYMTNMAIWQQCGLKSSSNFWMSYIRIRLPSWYSRRVLLDEL